MRRSRKRYGRYRGSRRGGSILIPVLVVLCIIAAGVLYFVNENMTYTKDGTSFLGLKKQEEPPTDAKLIIEDSSAGTESEVGSEAETEVLDQAAVSLPGAEVQSAGTKGYFMPIGTVKSAELFASALSEIPADAGINTIVFEVKAEDGTLAFVSDSQIAVKANVSGEDEVLSAAIAKARESGYKIALYMSCFKDDLGVKGNLEYSVKWENGTPWLDHNSTRWFDAYSSTAQDYLISCVEKLAGFKPDEIILSNISFPAVGKTEVIKYNEELGSKRDMLKSFIDDAKVAVGEIKLSAVYENYNDRRKAAGGQNAEDFTAFENIYMNKDESQFRAGFESGSALFESTECNLIPVGKDVSGEEFIIRK